MMGRFINTLRKIKLPQELVYGFMPGDGPEYTIKVTTLLGHYPANDDFSLTAFIVFPSHGCTMRCHQFVDQEEMDMTSSHF